MTVAVASTAEQRQYRFDGFLVDPVRRRLARDGEIVPVTPKAFSILLILLERQGEVVEKDELIRLIWPDTFVTEANLTQNVSALRKALGERANDHRYVVTVPGRGYSFVAEVREVEEELPPSRVDIPVVVLPRPEPAPERPARRGVLPAAGLLVLLVITAALLLFLWKPPEPPAAAVPGFGNLPGSPASQPQAARALQPGSPEAARLYAEGLARLRAFDTPNAVELLRRAAEVDPESAPILSALAQAWSALGYDARAREAARRAVELSGGLPRPERLAIEARSHEVNRQWARASEIYRTLWTFFPDDLEHGLHLAASLAAAGRGAEAMATVAELRRLPSPASDDPRIDLTEAETALRMSDPARVLAAARRAEQKGRASRESLVVALALRNQGAALVLQGDGPAAIRLFQQARTLFQEAGDTHGVATALAYVGISLQRQGDLAGAERFYLEALRIIEGLGNVASLAAQLGNLGILYQSQGDQERALVYLERSRAQFEEIDDPLLKSRVLSASASIHVQRGDLEEARSRFEEVLALSRKVGSRNDEARAFGSLAAILLWQGEVREANRLTREAFQILRDLDPSQSAVALAAWADTLARQGDLAGARQRLDQALSLKRQAGDRIGAGHILGVLALVEYRAGNLAAARARSQEQLRIARETGAVPLQYQGHQMLGRVDLAAGDLAAARRSLESALEESSSAGEDIRARAIQVDLARLELAEGDLEEAVRLAGEAAAWWRQRNVPWGEAPALAVQAEALAGQRGGSEAGAAAGRIHALIRRGEDRDLVLAVAPALARAEAAGGDVEGALRTLDQAVAEAGRRGFVAAGLEARLAAGEIRLLRGDPAARAGLGAVREEAAARGFRLLERRAERALSATKR